MLFRSGSNIARTDSSVAPKSRLPTNIFFKAISLRFDERNGAGRVLSARPAQSNAEASIPAGNALTRCVFDPRFRSGPGRVGGAECPPHDSGRLRLRLVPLHTTAPPGPSVTMSTKARRPGEIHFFYPPDTEFRSGARRVRKVLWILTRFTPSDRKSVV